MSFADGHANVHKWQDTGPNGTVRPIKYLRQQQINVDSSPDLVFLARATPRAQP
jgi:hypothetical protein